MESNGINPPALAKRKLKSLNSCCVGPLEEGIFMEDNIIEVLKEIVIDPKNVEWADKDWTFQIKRKRKLWIY